MIFTYYQDRVGTTHYVFYVGPPGCGKTNNLTLYQELAYRCMCSSGLTGPNMYQFLGIGEEGNGTIAEDEADDIDENRDKMKVYKNGTQRGKPYFRLDTSQGRNQAKYNTFCFKVAAAERLPDPEKAGGFMQRIIPIYCRNGLPENDIIEVINPMGDDDYEILREEIDDLHKRLLVHKLLNYHKKIPKIYTNLQNREKQLFLPILRIFQNEKSLDGLRTVLSKFVNDKRQENVDSFHAFLYKFIKELINQQKAQLKPNPDLIQFGRYWSLITDPELNPGKEVPNKPNSYDSAVYGVFSKKEVGAKLRVLGGKPPKHNGTQRQLVFDDKTIASLERMFAQTEEIQIQVSKTKPEAKTRSEPEWVSLFPFGRDGTDSRDTKPEQKVDARHKGDDSDQ
jgi:hypothetical protein